MIKNIYIDLDNTLLDFDKAEAIALDKTLRHLGLEPDDKLIRSYHEINKSFWRDLEKGLTTRDTLRVERFREFFRANNISANADEIYLYYEERLSEGTFFIEGAKSMLRELFDKYRLYLTSNGTLSVQEPRIKASGISKYFNKIFISHTMGAEKPSKAFFDLVSATIPDYSPTETIIIGDSLSSDILGGINAGIHTLFFNPKGTVPTGDIVPEYTVGKLSLVKPLIDSIC